MTIDLTTKFKTEASGCWIWTGYQQHGYGKYSGKYAHRIVYEALRGPVPNGFELDHLCRNKLCVNPDHLEAVTHQTNCARGDVGKHMREKLKTHCPRGHKLDGENVYIGTQGGGRMRRYCRTCHREQARSYYRGK